LATVSAPIRALVTGAAGFVGRALCEELLARGFEVRAGIRGIEKAAHLPTGCRPVFVGDLVQDPQVRELEDVSVVLHLAAKVHDFSPIKDAGSAYRQNNLQATEGLARAAAAAGVRRFVFVSTIKVNGERTSAGKVFRSSDAPVPADAYARSKWEAEQSLASIARKTGMEAVIVRPPLVYGPGVGANFLRLVRLVDRGVPLPLGSIKNRRSLVYIGNLVDLLAASATHPAAAGRTLLASDDEDVSTPQLIQHIAAALGTKPRLVSVPTWLLKVAGLLMRRSAEVARLLDSLAVEVAETRECLGWRPRFRVADGVADTISWYRSGYC
jgi:nucleoside-diphosphate-sugar epimerase